MDKRPAGKLHGDRVDHVVWVAHPENAQKYVDQLSELFRTSFDKREGGGVGGGLDVWVAWGAGLEIVTPFGRGQDDLTRLFFDHLVQHGEGIWGIVYGVEDLAEAAAHAKNLGWPVQPPLQNADKAVRTASARQWTKSVLDIHEAIIGEFLGSRLLFGTIEYS